MHGIRVLSLTSDALPDMLFCMNSLPAPFLRAEKKKFCGSHSELSF